MLQNDALISVIVPIYNVEQFLRPCVDSILNQTYSNLQIVLVDDGSTDSCSTICDEYASQDDRIFVIHKSNGGLSDARNAGIDIARGSYITFIDSDDVIAVDMIEYLYALFRISNADISVCQRADIDEAGVDIAVHKKMLKEDYILSNNKACMRDFMLRNFIDVSTWAKLYRLDLFCNIRYPKGRYHEDVFTTYKLIALSNIVAVGHQSKYYYRQRLGSITKQQFSPKHFDGVYGHLEMANFIGKYYPDLLPQAYSMLIYAANQCAYKMGCAGCVDSEYINRLLPIYRSYLVYFLRDPRAHLFSKMFALGSWCNLRMMIRLVKLLKFKVG